MKESSNTRDKLSTIKIKMKYKIYQVGHLEKDMKK